MHVKAGTCPITKGPIRAWTVEAIGPLKPGDSPDGSGRNPVVEGADMLIGLWDWGRVEEHLRSGWRSAETQAPRKGEQPLKWHLSTRWTGGEEMHLDACKGAGIETSEITHAAAAMAGLPQGSTYRVHVKGTRAGSDFHTKGVSIIHHTAARSARSGELPAWERPDVLLGVEDAKRLEGYLRAGWRRDQEAQGTLPTEEARRNVAAPVCFGDKPASGVTMTAAGEAIEQFGVKFREEARVLRHQAYGDDATTRAEEATRPKQPEAGERRSDRKEKEEWTYVQRIRTGVEGQGVELKVMFDNNTPHTLILHTTAARAALDPVGKRKLVMSPDSGEPEESLCRYSVPLVDWQGNTHLFKARGVDYTIYAGERKVPPKAAAQSCRTVPRDGASRAHQVVGMVDLIVGKDNSRWQPQKVCDSWQTEDNLTLMRSEFSLRYIARETTWTKRRT